jgi:hypothetical protein
MPAAQNVPTTAHYLDHGLMKKEASAAISAPATQDAKEVLDQGEADIFAAFHKNPQLANADLVNTATEKALNVGTGTSGATGRAKAALVLNESVSHSPQLANAALVKNVTSISLNDPNSFVRMRAQEALATVAIMRPDLIDADTVKAIQKTAALPASGDSVDNHIREVAQRSLKDIAETRPDLMTAHQASVAKSGATKVQVPPHALNAFRPSM